MDTLHLPAANVLLVSANDTPIFEGFSSYDPQLSMVVTLPADLKVASIDRCTEHINGAIENKIQCGVEFPCNWILSSVAKTVNDATYSMTEETKDLISYLDTLDKFSGLVSLRMHVGLFNRTALKPTELVSVVNEQIELLKNAGYYPVLHCDIAWYNAKLRNDKNEVSCPMWFDYITNGLSKDFPNDKYGRSMSLPENKSKICAWTYTRKFSASRTLKGTRYTSAAKILGDPFLEASAIRVGHLLRTVADSVDFTVECSEDVDATVEAAETVIKEAYGDDIVITSVTDDNNIAHFTVTPTIVELKDFNAGTLLASIEEILKPYFDADVEFTINMYENDKSLFKSVFTVYVIDGSGEGFGIVPYDKLLSGLHSIIEEFYGQDTAYTVTLTDDNTQFTVRIIGDSEGVFDVPDTELEPVIPVSRVTNVSFEAGAKIELKNVDIYTTSTAQKPSKQISGTYYIYAGRMYKGRYQIVDSPSDVGIKPSTEVVIGWVNKKDII